MGAHLRKLIRRTARVAIVVIACTVGTLGPLPTAARAEVVTFSGGCLLDLSLFYQSPVGRLPGQVSMGVSGSGTCVINATPTTISLSGSLGTSPLTGGWGCLAGVATGTATVSVPLPGWPGPLVQLVAVNTGGVITLVATVIVLPIPLTFEGVGTLVPDVLQNPLQEVSCVLGTSQGSGSWIGPFVFQDPTFK